MKLSVHSRGAKAWTLFCLEQQILFHIFVVWHPYNESWVGRLLLTLGILIYKVIKVIKPSKICENFFPQSYSWTCQFWSLHKEKSKYEKKKFNRAFDSRLMTKNIKTGSIGVKGLIFMQSRLFSEISISGSFSIDAIFHHMKF